MNNVKMLSISAVFWIIVCGSILLNKVEIAAGMGMGLAIFGIILLFYFAYLEDKGEI